MKFLFIHIARPSFNNRKTNNKFGSPLNPLSIAKVWWLPFNLNTHFQANYSNYLYPNRYITQKILTKIEILHLIRLGCYIFWLFIRPWRSNPLRSNTVFTFSSSAALRRSSAIANFFSICMLGLRIVWNELKFIVYIGFIW